MKTSPLRFRLVPSVFLTIAVVLAASAGRLAAQEKSVKPGINDHYAKQPLDAHLKVLENEQRGAIQQCDRLLAACQLKPGMVVADVGAGTGFFTRRIAAKVLPGGKVYAVEITKAFIEHINKTCREQKIDNVTTVLCTETSTELPADSADLIFVCDTYHHFEFPQKTLASIRQALRADGKLVIVEYHKAGKMTDHVRGDKKTTIEEITSAGFKLLGEEDNVGDQYILRFEKARATTALQYEIAPEEATGGSIATTIAMLERRLNPSFLKSPAKIAQVGHRRIRVELCEESAANVQRADYCITQIGVVHFQILAHPEVNKRVIALAKNLGKDDVHLYESGMIVARWAPVSREVAEALSDAATRKIEGDNGKARTEVLVMHDDVAPSGRHLAQCRATQEGGGRRAIELRFNAEGARRMKAFTASHKPDAQRNLHYRLAILWDYWVLAAPTLHAEIGGTAIITGMTSGQDVDDMVRILNSGALPVLLTRVSGPLPPSP